MALGRLRRVWTGDFMDCADEGVVDREDARRGIGTDSRGESWEERAVAWRKAATPDGVLGQLVSIGDVFSMVCGTS